MNKFNFACLLMLLTFAKVYTTTRVITVGEMTFAPTPAAVTVGDTIKWVWGAGIHTTTSTSVPAGATPWFAPIDSTHPSFKYVITAAGQYNYRCDYHYIFGMVGTLNASPLGIEIISGITPEKFELYQNYPNPFNPKTNIRFDIPERTSVKLIIYDAAGSEVKLLVNEELGQGSYSVNWDAAEYPSGIYFYKLEMKGFAEAKKMILTK